MARVHPTAPPDRWRVPLAAAHLDPAVVPAAAPRMEEAELRPVVLFVDDNEDDGELYARALAKAGLQPTYVRSAAAALAWLAAPGQRAPDLVVLDVNMPRVSGLEVLPELRRRCPQTPIVFLTAEPGGQETHVERLAQGADDWIQKGPDPRLLVARVTAILRRRRESFRIECADLVIDLLSRTVRRGARLVELSNREFDLLRVGFGRPGHLWTRAELLESVWDIHFDPETNVVNVHVARLRAKLERHGPRLIHTVRGEGYVFGLEAPPGAEAGGEPSLADPAEGTPAH